MYFGRVRRVLERFAARRYCGVQVRLLLQNRAQGIVSLGVVRLCCYSRAERGRRLLKLRLLHEYYAKSVMRLAQRGLEGDGFFQLANGFVKFILVPQGQAQIVMS